ncbi:MAG: carbon starvation protein A, partial [Nitrosospira sp.]|nr:carbon starvation protein A [Nitrosospira sp.]
MNRFIGTLGWLVLAVLGAFAFVVIALQHGESIGAIWIVVATVCIYASAYRVYSLFIASRVLRLDATRMTPAYKFNDGLDYVPTNKHVLFGHHFAAI